MVVCHGLCALTAPHSAFSLARGRENAPPPIPPHPEGWRGEPHRTEHHPSPELEGGAGEGASPRPPQMLRRALLRDLAEPLGVMPLSATSRSSSAAKLRRSTVVITACS